MAARKKAAKKNGSSSRAVAKRAPSALSVPSEIPADWRDRLEKYAKRDAATTAGATGWPYIGTRNGIFRFNEDNLEELPPMIILGVRFENTYFTGNFDPDSPQAPECFALAEKEEELAPPEFLADKRQCMQSEPSSDKCSGCWANAFNTADRGRGKACKNVRRIAVLPADNLDVKHLSQVDGAMIRIPVTSVKNYSTFANKVTKGLGIPLFMIRTDIGIEEDEKTQFRVTFEPFDMADTDRGPVPMVISDTNLLEVLEARVKEADTYLDQHPNLTADDDAPQKKGGKSRTRRAVTSGGRKKAVKKAVRKKASRKAGTRRAGGSKAAKY